MIKRIAYGILIVFGLSLFSSLTIYVHSGYSIGFLTKPFVQFINFPEKVYKSITQSFSLSEQFIKTSSGLEHINRLKEDVIVLYSVSVDDSNRKVVLKNLKTDSVHNVWDIKEQFQRKIRLFNPILLSNNHLIVHENGGRIMRLDSKGNTVWIGNDTIKSHHSLNLDFENNIWSPGRFKTNNGAMELSQELAFPGRREMLYEGDLIVKWNTETGEPIYIKSITDILKENGLSHEIKKANFFDGPYHLNDIQPVLKDGENMKRGDVLLSLRNTSSIIHFRPETNKVVRYIEGPFSYQHDVDIQDDSTITLFNNSVINELKYNKRKPKNIRGSVKTESSQILKYHYNTQKFDTLVWKPFREENIFMRYEGLHHIMTNNILVEDREKATLWILNDTSVVYKNVIPSHQKGYHHMLNWTRVIENK